MDIIILNRVDRQGLTSEMTVEQIYEGNESMRHGNSQGKNMSKKETASSKVLQWEHTGMMEISVETRNA